MRTMQYRNAKSRIGITPLDCMEWASDQALPAFEDGVEAAMEALIGIENVVLHECFDCPEALTQDGIMSYALALLRLRECASEAGFERLMNACDALAVTVSRLMEDKNCASPEKCKALTRFVAHARAMIEMHDTGIRRQSMPNAVAPVEANMLNHDARH